MTLGILAAQTTAEQPELTGIFQIGDTRLAALQMPGALPAVQWTKQGDAVGEYTLAEVRDDSVVLKTRSEDAKGAELVVTLKQPTILSLDDATSGAFTMERIRWINSRNNPMVHRPAPLPFDGQTRWSHMSEEEQSAIQQWYLAHGWRLRASVLDEGFVEFSFESVFEEYREKVLAENLRRFKQTFSPRQRALWDSVFGNASVTGERTLDDVSESERANISRNSAAFDASLTPEQEAMRRRLRDFTRDQTPRSGATPSTQDGAAP